MKRVSFISFFLTSCTHAEALFRLCTAREAILRPMPGLDQRTSPHSSNSKTRSRNIRTFSGLSAWPDFLLRMDSLAERLDNSTRSFAPIVVAGLPAEQSFDAAAEECEIRAPLQNASRLLNAVAESMGLMVRLEGGGSGRSCSFTDYVIKVHKKARSQGGRTHKKDLSLDVLGDVEVKGPWQWLMELGANISSMTEEELKGLEPALQQCYGDMVLDEAPFGMASSHRNGLLLNTLIIVFSI